jgi:hypothetical protein
MFRVRRILKENKYNEKTDFYSIKLCFFFFNKNILSIVFEIRNFCDEIYLNGCVILAINKYI